MDDKIDKLKWYTAKEVADFLKVTEASVKKYCKEGTITGKQIGPRKQWHIQGVEIQRLRKKWGLDTIQA